MKKSGETTRVVENAFAAASRLADNKPKGMKAVWITGQDESKKKQVLSRVRDMLDGKRADIIWLVRDKNNRSRVRFFHGENP